MPAAAVKLVMASVTDPAAKEIFEAAAEPPHSDAAWQKVQDSAAVTAASAKQILKAVRGGNRTEWAELAKAMASASEQAGAAAAAHDATALSAAGDVLYASCERCHALFQSRRGG